MPSCHREARTGDLYALGCVLYELLCGRPPFVGKTAPEVLWQHLEAEPEPPSSRAARVGPEIDELVLRLLEKEPARRLGYADDVAAALARLGASTAAEAELPAPRTYLYRPGFTGREAVLAELESELARLQVAGGGLALVGGESGAGKTRLALELARRAARRGVRVLSGECLPGVATRSGSARAPRSAADRSPSSAGGGAALEGLRRPLQVVADRCRAGGLAETERLLGLRGKVGAL